MRVSAGARPSGGGGGSASARLQNRTPCTSPALPEVWDLIDRFYRVDPTLQLAHRTTLWPCPDGALSGCGHHKNYKTHAHACLTTNYSSTATVYRLATHVPRRRDRTTTNNRALRSWQKFSSAFATCHSPPQLPKPTRREQHSTACESMGEGHA